MVKYFIHNYLENIEEENSKNLFSLGLKYYNFAFIQNEFINKNSFFDFCKYDYYEFVNLLLIYEDIDINKKESTFKGEKDLIFLDYLKKKQKEEEKSFLYIAVEKENTEIVRLLLTNKKLDINSIHIFYTPKKGGGSNEFYRYEKAALHVAVEKENHEIVNLLLNNTNTDVNIQYIKNGYDNDDRSEGSREEMNIKTSLYMAIEERNIKIFKLLLNNENIDVNLEFDYEYCRGSNDYGETGWVVMKYTPLSAAIENEMIEIVQLLLANEKLDINALSKSGQQLRKKEKITDNSVSEKTAFFIAVIKANVEIVQLLLANKNIDINIPATVGEKTRETALYEAVEKDHIEIVRLLLANEKLDINAINKIHANYYYQEPKNSEWMAQFMGYVTSSMEDAIQEKTAFYNAVQKGKIEIIQLLLNAENIDVNIPYKTYYYKDNEWIVKLEKTAFNEAVDKENIEIIKAFLKSAKIDFNIPNKGEGKIDDTIIAEAEKTAFYFAVEKENIDFIQLLVNNDKIDINVPYKCSENVIPVTNDIKSQKEKINVIQRILKAEHFNVILNDKKRINQTRIKTALHLAAEKGNTNVIKLLLGNKNININIKDEKGEMPIDYATNDEIKQIFNYMVPKSMCSIS